MHGVVKSAPLGADLYREVLDELSVAIVVVDSAGAVVGHNRSAREMLGAILDHPGARCCDLVGCGRGPGSQPLAYHCITAAVLEHGRPLRALDGALADRRPIKITAAPLAAGAMLQIRPRAYDLSLIHI